MRLDKFLSKSAQLSRKEAKRVLLAGQISVNDTVIKDASLHINDNDKVMWGDEILSVATGARYILLNKPKDFECSLAPKHYPSVLDLIDVPQVTDLRMAGRLDVDTTGALILSDDGQFLHKITSPKRHLPKRYQITLADPMDSAMQAHAIDKIGQGVLLDGEREPTLPALLEFGDERHATLTLTQGKYHQVKRMMAYFGNAVVDLHRSHIGALDLTSLELGECRFLTKDEIAQFG